MLKVNISTRIPVDFLQIIVEQAAILKINKSSYIEKLLMNGIAIMRINDNAEKVGDKKTELFSEMILLAGIKKIRQKNEMMFDFDTYMRLGHN